MLRILVMPGDSHPRSGRVTPAPPHRRENTSPPHRRVSRPARPSRSVRRARALARTWWPIVQVAERDRDGLPLPQMVRTVLQVMAWATLPVFRGILREVQSEVGPDPLVVPHPPPAASSASAANSAPDVSAPLPEASTSSPSPRHPPTERMTPRIPNPEEIDIDLDCVVCYEETNSMTPCGHSFMFKL